jgi:hypothetical protein
MRRSYERYLRLLEVYRAHVLSESDSFSDKLLHVNHPLVESKILNVLWTAAEKERFFTALARCGKGDVEEITRRVRTKSLVEVTAYIGILDEETMWRKQGRYRFFDTAKIPAAVEVDEDWLNFEETAATVLIRNDNHRTEEALSDEDSVFNVERANELAKWYQQMFPHKAIEATVSPDLISDLETHVVQITRRLIRAACFLALAHARNSPSTTPPTVTLHDARAATDIIGLPRQFRAHFTSLPKRMEPFGVTILSMKNNYYKSLGMDKTVTTTADIAEMVLSKRPERLYARRTQRPEKWDVNNGFDWPDKTTEDESEETRPVSHVRYVEIVPENETDRPRRRPSRKHRLLKEQNKLLDAETLYLDTLDGNFTSIEQTCLHTLIHRGAAAANDARYQAVKALKRDPELKEGKRTWDAVRNRYMAIYGPHWMEMVREVVGFEGVGFEGRAETWELQRKEQPVSAGKRKVSGTGGKTKRQKVAGEDEEEGSQFDPDEMT